MLKIRNLALLFVFAALFALIGAAFMSALTNSNGSIIRNARAEEKTNTACGNADGTACPGSNPPQAGSTVTDMGPSTAGYMPSESGQTGQPTTNVPNPFIPGKVNFGPPQVTCFPGSLSASCKHGDKLNPTTTNPTPPTPTSTGVSRCANNPLSCTHEVFNSDIQFPKSSTTSPTSTPTNCGINPNAPPCCTPGGDNPKCIGTPTSTPTPIPPTPPTPVSLFGWIFGTGGQPSGLGPWLRDVIDASVGNALQQRGLILERTATGNNNLLSGSFDGFGIPQLRTSLNPGDGITDSNFATSNINQHIGDMLRSGIRNNIDIDNINNNNNNNDWLSQIAKMTDYIR
jgi:hypothetical protein